MLAPKLVTTTVKDCGRWGHIPVKQLPVVSRVDDVVKYGIPWGPMERGEWRNSAHQVYTAKWTCCSRLMIELSGGTDVGAAAN